MTEELLAAARSPHLSLAAKGLFLQLMADPGQTVERIKSVRDMERSAKTEEDYELSVAAIDLCSSCYVTRIHPELKGCRALLVELGLILEAT